jgi:hypothetical protein
LVFGHWRATKYKKLGWVKVIRYISPHYANDNIDSFKIVKRQIIHHKYARNQKYMINI